jgi:hypothetical protein
MHWEYRIKRDGTRRSRQCCDGSPRAAPALHRLVSTYSSCVEQPIQRLFYALAAQLNYHVFGGDAKDAYAHSPPPKVPTYVHVDDAYADWYHARCGNPVDRTLVLPVQHALQGHPESGKRWEDHINSNLFLRSSPCKQQPMTAPFIKLIPMVNLCCSCGRLMTSLWHAVWKQQRELFLMLLDGNSNCLANQIPPLFTSGWSQTLTALMCTKDNHYRAFPWKTTSPVY